jgi:hypothetical protein
VADEHQQGTFWTTLPGILTGIAAIITAIGAVVAGLAAVGAFDDQASPSPTAETSAAAGASPTSTPTSPVLVACTGDLETGVGGSLGASQSTYVATRDMCITTLNLYETTAGTGLAMLKLDGATVFSIDLDNFDNIGEPGGGSGERSVRLGRVIGVAEGQTVSLDFSGCATCGGLSVYFEAAPR